MGSSDADKGFVADCIALTNKYRILHQVAPLTYSPELESFARAWAETQAKISGFNHRPTENRVLNGKQLGENMAGSSPGDPITASQAVDQWYGEVTKYNFQTNSGVLDDIGHFTQLVWKDTKEFGISRALRKDGWWIAVANYYPAGNGDGQFAANVLPAKN